MLHVAYCVVADVYTCVLHTTCCLLFAADAVVGVVFCECSVACVESDVVCLRA